MAIERKWLPVTAVGITSPGTSDGKITVTSALGFKVKMIVLIDGAPGPQRLQVKRVSGAQSLELGPVGGSLESRSDLSGYNAPDTIMAFMQTRSDIPLQEATRATYEEEPTVAWRTVQVDPFGRFYTVDNPLPVQLSDGSINIETLNANLSVQLTHRDNYPSPGDVADSIRVGDGLHILDINPDGSINVNIQSGGGQPQEEISVYSEVSSVASSVLTTILTYTVPPTRDAELHRISVNGDNIAKYTVLLNGSTLDRRFTYFSGPLSETFDFITSEGGFPIYTGDVIEVKVIHERPFLGDFGARLQALEIG